MPDTEVVWVIDTSSVIAVRRNVQNSLKADVFRAMSALVAGKRLYYPKQVSSELGRVADPDAPDPQYRWTRENLATASSEEPSLDEVKQVLAAVPRVLDPDKDTGEEEADPYVLATAVRLRNEGKDARVVTEEKTDTPRKMSLNTAAGFVGVPSVPLLAFLEFEGILF